MTWQEILESRQHHPIEINRLCPAAQRRLAEISQDDIDDLISLRLGGRERIWGIRDGATLKLLWWDPDHQVCPATLKHT